MRALVLAAVVLLASCTPAGSTAPPHDPPGGPTPPAGGASSGRVYSGGETGLDGNGPAPPPLTPSICAANNADPEHAHCRWSVGTSYYCGGAPPPRNMPMNFPTCICNGCDKDIDCGSGYHCRELPAWSCMSEAKACIPDTDVCSSGDDKCEIGCTHDGLGHGGCKGRAPPMP